MTSCMSAIRQFVLVWAQGSLAESHGLTSFCVPDPCRMHHSSHAQVLPRLTCKQRIFFFLFANLLWFRFSYHLFLASYMSNIELEAFLTNDSFDLPVNGHWMSLQKVNWGKWITFTDFLGNTKSRQLSLYKLWRLFWNIKVLLGLFSVCIPAC